MKKIYLVFVLYTALVTAQNNFWEQTNGPFGGEVRALAFDSANHIFVGTSTGGVFRSLDDGAIWVQTNSGLTFSDILMVKSLANGILFAATRDSGVFRSSNNGNNWSHTSLTTEISTFVVNSSGHIFAGSHFGGIFRSTDDGNSWDSVTSGLGYTSIYSLAIDSNGYVFAGTYFEGIFRSTNNGDNWTAIGLLNKWIYSLSITSSNDILAGSDSLYRSTDNGQTWNYINIGLTSMYRVDDLAVSSSGNFSGTIFANVYDYSGLGGVFRSTDNGVKWMRINNGLSDSLNLRSLAISPSGDVFVGTEHGLFRSTNNGDNWFLTGVPNSYIASLMPSIGGQIFASTFWEFTRGILFRTSNEGDDWIVDNTGLESTMVTCLTTDSMDHLIAGTLKGIYRSTSVGGNWSFIALVNASVGSFVHTLSGDILAGTNIGVYRSTNEASNWIYSSAGMISTNVSRLVVSNNGNYIFAGTRAGIFRSSNEGSTWSYAGNGVTDTIINSLVVNSAGHLFSGTRLGVFRSTNNGTSWSQMNVGLTNLYVYSLVVNSIDHIFAGTRDGVFRSTDNAETWSNVNLGLPNTYVRPLLITPTGLLLAGTLGSGVFRSIQSTTSVASGVVSIPLTFVLEQNFPNPFNPSTSIQYAVSNRQFVTLKVYDMLGREIATLVNEEKEPGIYRAEFNTRDYQLASGIYLYQLQAGSYVETKKMVLMK